MKHKTLPFAYLLLCVNLLPLPGPVVARQHNSRKSKTKSKTAEVQRPMAATTASSIEPAPPAMAGSYTLDDAGATQTVEAAIETAVKELSMFSKGPVQSKLKETNLPPPKRLTISFTDAEVSIATDIAGEVRTSKDGVPLDWSKGKDKYKVSTIWDACNLVRTYKGAEAERVNVYSLGDDGRILTMHVTVTREALVGRFKLDYKLIYRRTP